MLRTITAHSRYSLRYVQPLHFSQSRGSTSYLPNCFPLTRGRSSSIPSLHLLSQRIDSPKPIPGGFLPTMSTSAATQLSAIESAKRAAAQLAVKEHFNPEARYIGIGSGSTIVYVVEAIQELKDPRVKNILFVPTGYQSRQVRWQNALANHEW